ncbi:beta-glucuronidase [Bryocella elongata]|uniref:Beta-glucuronidase n=1 Tax=Bryocella elongata TaxID=863522 RepID=A0A1H5UZ61_9BACT|nr:glycoside hydrolase family 2 TIM barrel-domain containing protein [Bryocella elongata]SEF80379.1 beta-glucuronidase [Bryocella elongata]
MIQRHRLKLCAIFRAAAVAILSLSTIACVAFCQQPLQTLLVGIDRRPAASLDGDWHYLVDQAPGRALYNADGSINDNSYAMNEHPVIVGKHNEEYDFSTAPTIRVPGDWNTQVPQLFNYEGVVWYQRDFEVQPAAANTRTFLHIGAANYRTHVWVNRRRACDHEGGYTPFDCEVTSVLHPGTNFVVIAVDATRLVDGIPSVGIDWFNYGGLTRDVSLVTVPSVFIDDYDVHLEHGSQFDPANTELTGYVHVIGAGAGTRITVAIPEAAVNAVATIDASGNAPFRVKATHFTLWSPETPKLYKVTLSCGEDSLTDDIGFRDIRVDGTRILLNGKAKFLEGANLHAEAPIRGGRAYSDVDVATLFGYLKDLNANFVRLAHYPHDERMEREADRDGIMVWSEIPNWQHISYEKPEVYAKDVIMLKEMIRRDRNKASVILWSVSNETPNNPTRTTFLTNLANEARTLDPTRLITSAIIGPRAKGLDMINDDPLCEALDVVGQDEYIGWYDLTPEDADKIHWTLPQKPVLISEFGAEAKYGNHGAPTNRWTEEQQVYVFQHQFAMLQKIPQLRGTIPWILMDFRSPVRNIPGLQDGYNRKGLISEDGQKKLAFRLFKDAYEKHSLGKPE